MKTMIWVTAQFAAFHRWLDAPDDVSFLRQYHRHMFHVKVWVRVTHSDRDVEFFQFKRKLELVIDDKLRDREFDMSCEMIAETLLHSLPESVAAEVSEDGENGAIVMRG